ncbi:MAG: hypothetical protein HWE39_15685 [Oceanospirillaceae bacterium]|nr:hypothetical protein [Oceanospirillaceae bacterium]
MKKTSKMSQFDSPPIKSPEKRLPKAAVGYIDALLEAQRMRFVKEHAATPAAASTTSSPALPAKLDLLAESDAFVGSGWGPLDKNRKGVPHRWMARLGTILLAADTSKGGQLTLTGTGYLRRRYVDDLTVWIDDQPVEGVAVRKGLNAWIFEGRVPALENRPFHILGLQTSGIKAFHLGPDTHASLALSKISFKAG